MDEALLPARLQFALQISFHILFPAITIALGWFLFWVKWRYRRTGDEAWMAVYRLWTKIFVLTFALGVVSGIVLGRYVMGFAPGWGETVFAAVSALGVTLAYVLVRVFWLIWRTEGALQRRVVVWARGALLGVGVGLAAVSLATPLVLERIAARWFSWPETLWLAPLPLATVVLAAWLWGRLRVLLLPGDAGGEVPSGRSSGCSRWPSWAWHGRSTPGWYRIG